MRVLITTEAHFSVDCQKYIYVDEPAKYPVWANYLQAFDEVKILARVGKSAREYPEEARADGPSVSFLGLPDYHGPWQYLLNLPELTRRAQRAVDACDAYVLRVPGLVGRLVWRELRKRKKPYALEVVADPWDAMGPGTWPGIFRPAFRHFGTLELKTMCQEASAVHYVTQSALQRRYPAGKNAYSAGFSDVVLDGAFASQEKMDARFRRIAEIAPAAINCAQSNVRAELPGAKGPTLSLGLPSGGLKATLPRINAGAPTTSARRPPQRAELPRAKALDSISALLSHDTNRRAPWTEVQGFHPKRRSVDAGAPTTNGVSRETQPANPFRIGFVGSFSQMYKGPDVLLHAVATCKSRGWYLEAALAGEGRCVDAMKSRANELGISDRVQFLGQLPSGRSVFAFLDSIDLFVMPSYAEGLPRALLEAMAGGCPCIASAIGGIPELLDAAELVPMGEPKALADKIMEVAANGERMKQMAMRNLEKARKYSPELLRDVRREFCRMVRVRAEKGRGD